VSIQQDIDAPQLQDTQTRHDQHGRWIIANTVEDFRHNLADVHARIAAACARVDRRADSVRLLPVRACFVRLRTLRDHLRQDAPDGIVLDDLSMGMSGNYEIAIEEGATVVRVGQAVFGGRHAH